IERTQVKPLASEKAAPEFLTKWNCRSSPSTGTTSPTSRFETMRYLASWSSARIPAATAPSRTKARTLTRARPSLPGAACGSVAAKTGELGVALRIRRVLGLLRALRGLLLRRVLGCHLRSRETGVSGGRRRGRRLRRRSLREVAERGSGELLGRRLRDDRRVVRGRCLDRRLVRGRSVDDRGVVARRVGHGRAVGGRRRAVGGRGGTEGARCLAARDRRGVLELAQLALDVAAQLVAVLGLEDAKFLDGTLEARLLGLECLDRGALLVLGVRDEARCGRMALRDELVALLHALAHVLLVEATGELQEVVG